MWQFFEFICIVILVYGIPGWVTLTKLRIKSPLVELASIPLGIVFWGWQAWIFGLAGVRVLTYGYLAIFWAVALLHLLHATRKRITNSLQNVFRFDRISALIFIAGVFAQFLFVWHVLVPYQGSVALCCGDGRDDIWYAAITQSLVHRVPGDFPGMIGEPLRNNHIWSNLVVADIVRIFHVPQFPFQFQFSGFLLSVSLGFAVMALTYSLGAGIVFQRWLLFFIFFGGDALYLISLYTQHRFGFPGSSLEDGVRFLSNVPRSYAIVFSLIWYALWPSWKKRPTAMHTIVYALFGAAIVGFKIYVAVFVLAGLALEAIYALMQRKWPIVWLALITMTCAAMVYVPINTSAGGFYWTGFWVFENFIVQPNFGLARLEMAREIFYNAHKYGKAYIYDALFVFIYVVSIFGTKLVGLAQSQKARRILPMDIHRMLLMGLFVSLFVGSFFQQKTGGSNTFNFLVNVFILGSIYTAAAMSGLSSMISKGKYIILSLLVILLTIPRAVTVVATTYTQTTHLSPIVSSDIYSAYQWIGSHTKPSDIMVSLSRSVYADGLTPLSALMTGRQYYLLSAPMLQLFGVHTQEKEQVLKTLYTSTDPKLVKAMLEEAGITYILVDTHDQSVGEAIRGSTVAVYTNPSITVMRVR